MTGERKFVMETVEEYNELLEAHCVLALARNNRPNRTKEERDAERSAMAAVLAAADRSGVIDARDVYRIELDGSVVRRETGKRIADLSAPPHQFLNYYGRVDRFASYLLNRGDRLIVVKIPR